LHQERDIWVIKKTKITEKTEKKTEKTQKFVIQQNQREIRGSNKR
jgi:hypothetical protein